MLEERERERREGERRGEGGRERQRERGREGGRASKRETGPDARIFEVAARSTHERGSSIVNFVKMSSTVGNKCPQNGSKKVPPVPSDTAAKGLAWITGQARDLSPLSVFIITLEHRVE